MYRCTMWWATNMCNKTRQEVRKDISYLKKKTWTDSRNAWKTFVDAWWRLRAVFGIGSKEDKKAIKQRENALLHSYRGKDVSKQQRRQKFNRTYEKRWSPLSTKSLVHIIKENWKLESWIWKEFLWNHDILSKAKSKKPLPARRFDLQKTQTIDAKRAVLEALSDNIEEREKFKQLYLKNQERSYEWQKNISQMKTAFYDVLRMQQTMEQENVFIDVRRVTQQFPALSAMVYQNINLIGDKWDEGKLYNAMWYVCEQQCTNLNGKKKCWADQ